MDSGPEVAPGEFVPRGWDVDRGLGGGEGAGGKALRGLPFAQISAKGRGQQGGGAVGVRGSVQAGVDRADGVAIAKGA